MADGEHVLLALQKQTEAFCCVAGHFALKMMTVIILQVADGAGNYKAFY